MCYNCKCRAQMNIEIQQIIEQVKQIGIDEDETLVLTEIDMGVEISKIQTKFAYQLDLEHETCIRIRFLLFSCYVVYIYVLIHCLLVLYVYCNFYTSKIYCVTKNMLISTNHTGN